MTNIDTSGFERRPGGRSLMVLRGVNTPDMRRAAAMALAPGATTIVRRRAVAGAPQVLPSGRPTPGVAAKLNSNYRASLAKAAIAKAKVKPKSPRRMPLDTALRSNKASRLRGKAHGCR